ncbi:MAG: GMC family oxidoreductase, partial [Sphingomicrobium sp.]
VGARLWSVLTAFGKHGFGNSQFAPLLTPSPALQQKLGILNSGLGIAARPKAGGRRPLMKEVYLYAKHRASPTKAGRGVWKTTRRFGRRLKRFTGPIKPWWACTSGRSELALVLRAEQAPNPDSRVTLGDSVDATGMPRVRLDWRLKDQDVETASALVDAVARHVASRGLGRIEPAQWLSERPRQWTFDDLISDHPIGGYHHMGTTRMAEDPRKGVTDGYGRVHGLDNLYVVGSSLFPTGGWANPTLTILALSLRTAERLLSQLKTKAPIRPGKA